MELGLWVRLAVVGILFIVVFTIILTIRYVGIEDAGPWYLGCSDGVKEYMMEVSDRPVVDGGVVMIGSDMFVVPNAGMTCRIVRVRDVVGIDKVVEK